MKALLATDGSAHAQAALDLLGRLPLSGATEATVLTVVPDLGLPTYEEQDPTSYAQLRQLQRTEADRTLAEACDQLRGTGWTLRPERRDGYPAQEILRMAAELPADLVAVGSRGLGRLKRYLLGSVSHRVVRHCSCSVLVGRPGRQGESKPSPLRVLLAFDGSEPAWAALRSLASLSPSGLVQLSVVHVMTLVTTFRMDVIQKLGPVFQAQEEAALAGLAKAAEPLKEAGYQVQTELLEGDDASHVIVDRARKEGVDLIVLGDRGYGAVERFLLGSVTTKVLHHAESSVLVVKGEGLPVNDER